MEVATSETPFERASELLVVSLEMLKPLFEGIEVGKVVWSKDLAPNDGEIDLDLVQPTGVN